MRKIWYTINLSFHIVNLPHREEDSKLLWNGKTWILDRNTVL